MPDSLRYETPAEYFKGLVEDALVNQRVDVDELTTFYLVNMLCGFVRAPEDASFDDEPLALRLGEALESGGLEQRRRLRRLGDASLFVSGYFADSLNRRLVDVDYYVALGGYAYGSLGRLEDEVFAGVFVDLAERFVTFVDVLGEVSEQSGLSSNTDLLRLYEKWLRTGSRRDGRRLAERGIVTNPATASRVPH